MYNSDDRIEKWEVEVEVRLDNGTQLLGMVFVNPTHRVSDLLNDNRQFLPVRLTDGHIQHVRKQIIAQLVELDIDIEPKGVIDPYEVLGVRQSIDDEELKITYRHLCMQNHPDKLQALDVAPEIVRFANARLRRIIDAYDRIMAVRGARSRLEVEAEAESVADAVTD